MLIGHLGLAFFAKRAHTAEPLIWLATAAFLPDIVRFGLLFAVESTRAELASHSIPAVLILAALWMAIVRLRSGLWTTALVAALLTLSHYGGDLVTGCKPTWLGGPYIGLGLYHRPLIDLLVEIPLLALSWKLMRDHLPPASAITRGWMTMALVLLQVTFLVSNCRGSVCLVGQSVWKWVPEDARWPFRVEQDPYRCAPAVLPASWRRT